MAGDDISVSIGVQGESAFKKALIECQNSVKQLDSALKANAAEYENNADALGENVERVKLLRQSLEMQKKMADGLGDAVKYASDKYGEASSQTTKYVVAQNKAKEAVAKLEKELKDADREMEELGRDSRTVGQQLESGIGSSAKETAKSIEEMYDQLKTRIDDIRNAAGFTVMADVAGGIFDAAQGLNDFAESTREYRRQIGFLEQNAVDAGMEWAAVKAQLDEIKTVTGDMDSSVEGISNLLATGFDSTELETAVDALAGAVIKFPDTLKFESLADGLQETIATGTAVGQFAELLERSGVEIDEFNAAMAKATTEEERQQIALSYLANHGLEATYEGWKKNNEGLINAETASQKLTDKMAALGDQVEPMGTAMTELAAATVGTVTALLADTQVDEWITGKINAITEIVTLIATAEGRAELMKRATEGMGETYSVDDFDIDEQIENQKRAIAELKYTGDAVMLMSAEQKLAELEAAKAAGEESGTEMVTALQEEVQAQEETLKTAGKDAMQEVADGITEGGQAAIDNAETVASSIQGSLDSIDSSGAVQQMNNFYRAIGAGSMVKGWNLGSGGSGQQESGNPALQISMSIDGQKFASVTAPYTSAALGRITEMTA